MNIDRLKEIRKDRDLQQKDVAKILKCNHTAFFEAIRILKTKVK